LKTIQEELKYESEAAEAIIQIAGEIQIQSINFRPYFKQLAAQGNMLYCPFDTHWNSEGRQTSVEFVADSLGWRSQSGNSVEPQHHDIRFKSHV